MHLFYWLTGLLPNSRMALAWGGILSAGLISTGLFTGVWQRYRINNCHSRRCPWIARHPYVDADGVEHRFCRHCHPVLKGTHRTRDEIHAHHAARAEYR